MSDNVRSRRVMLILGLLLVLMGTVSIGVNLPYLPDGGGWEPAVPWVSAGGGVLGFAGGIWCLIQVWRGPETTGLVLRRSGYYMFSLIMLGVCVALLVAGLTLSEPATITGLSAMLAVSFVRGMFTARRPAAPPRQDAAQPGSSGG